MPRLREMLAQQGIELGESSIQQGNSQSDTGGDGQQNGRGQQANQQQNEEESALTQQPIRGSATIFIINRLLCLTPAII